MSCKFDYGVYRDAGVDYVIANGGGDARGNGVSGSHGGRVGLVDLCEGEDQMSDDWIYDTYRGQFDRARIARMVADVVAEVDASGFLGPVPVAAEKRLDSAVGVSDCVEEIGHRAAEYDVGALPRGSRLGQAVVSGGELSDEVSQRGAFASGGVIRRVESYVSDPGVTGVAGTELDGSGGMLVDVFGVGENRGNAVGGVCAFGDAESGGTCYRRLFAEPYSRGVLELGSDPWLCKVLSIDKDQLRSDWTSFMVTEVAAGRYHVAREGFHSVLEAFLSSVNHNPGYHFPKNSLGDWLSGVCWQEMDKGLVRSPGMYDVCGAKAGVGDAYRSFVGPSWADYPIRDFSSADAGCPVHVRKTATVSEGRSSLVTESLTERLDVLLLMPASGVFNKGLLFIPRTVVVLNADGSLHAGPFWYKVAAGGCVSMWFPNTARLSSGRFAFTADTDFPGGLDAGLLLDSLGTELAPGSWFRG